MFWLVSIDILKCTNISSLEVLIIEQRITTSKFYKVEIQDITQIY